MIVGYDAKRVFRNFTGLGNYCRNTLDMLAQYHPEVEQRLYTPGIGKANERTKRFTDHAVLPDGLLRNSLWRTFSMGKQASKTCDIFHGLSHELPFRLTIPSVVTMHDVAFNVYTKMYTTIDRQIYNLKWAYACRHATHVIAISDSTRYDVQRFFGVDDKRISVVYQPVHPCFYTDIPTTLPHHDGVPSDYALYVGSINSRKNLLSIIQAMERLPASARLPLVVVGDGHSYKQQVLSYVAEKGLQPWVLMLGSVGSIEQLQALYHHARVFVYPSHYEGMGLPVIEAQLSGCPVITSNVSSLPEAGGDAAIQVSPTDIDALSDALRMVTTDNALANNMRHEGRERCMRLFHPRILAQQLMTVYDAMIEDKQL